MTDKLQILQAITDTFKAITPANGYVTDLSDFDPGDGIDKPRIYRGRAYFGENDPLPLVSVLEAVGGDDLIAQQTEDTPTSEYWWSLIIQGWVKDDPLNPTDPAYALLKDVRKCLATELKRRDSNRNRLHFGLPESIVQGMRFSGGVVRPSNELSAFAGFVLLLDLRIVDRADG